MPTFKKGDRLRCINAREGSALTLNAIYTALADSFGGTNSVEELVIVEHGDTYGWWVSRFVKVDNSITKDNMDLLEKFSVAFKSEPEKTFRKAGITNGDDFLTDEGLKIFMSWMLKKYGPDFKKEVVDEIIKNESKN